LKLSRADTAALLVLSLGWLACSLYIDPRGVFPLNDDFAYASSVRHFIASGELRLSQWSMPSCLIHILLGSLTALLGGPSNENLRLLMLGMGLATSLLFFLLLRELRISPARSLAGAACLAFNPIFFAMSASFHTEISFLFFFLAALWAFLRFLRDESLSWACACSFLLALALLTRQIAIFSIAGAVLFFYSRKKLGYKMAGALCIPAGLAAAGFGSWLYFVHGATWALSSGLQTPRLTFSLLTINGYLQTLAGFLLPLALASLPFVFRREKRSVPETLLFLGLSGMALLGLLKDGGMPLLGNTIHSRGLGVLTLNDPGQKWAGLWHWPFIWRGVDALCLAAGLVLARLFFRRPLAREGKAVLWFCFPAFLPLLFMPVAYDRYLLTILPALIIVVLLLVETVSFSLPLAALSCALMTSVSAIGLKDYFAWNRARWDAGAYAVRSGVALEAVENGFDWNGQHTFERNTARLLARKRPEDIGLWDWMTLNRIQMLTSFSAAPSREDFVLLKEFPYRTPLGGAPAVYLYRYAPKKGRSGK
jgi:4-amino-4-deoxy-L-arabinose transferase-like glycosyltransferase